LWKDPCFIPSKNHLGINYLETLIGDLGLRLYKFEEKTGIGVKENRMENIR